MKTTGFANFDLSTDPTDRAPQCEKGPVCTPSDDKAIAGAPCMCKASEECGVGKFCWADKTCNVAAKPRKPFDKLESVALVEWGTCGHKSSPCSSNYDTCYQEAKAECDKIKCVGFLVKKAGGYQFVTYSGPLSCVETNTRSDRHWDLYAPFERPHCTPSDDKAITGLACVCEASEECGVGKYCWTDKTCNVAPSPSPTPSDDTGGADTSPSPSDNAKGAPFTSPSPSDDAEGAPFTSPSPSDAAEGAPFTSPSPSDDQL